MASDETALEQARRHVREGEQRVAEQFHRIEELRRDGHDVGQAEDFLVLLEQTLTVMREHLAEEERQHSPGSSCLL